MPWATCSTACGVMTSSVQRKPAISASSAPANRNARSRIAMTPVPCCKRPSCRHGPALRTLDALLSTRTATLTREAAQALDMADPLARFADAFDLPSGLIYLDGNSLGPPPIAAHERLERVSRREWGEGLVRSWN